MAPHREAMYGGAAGGGKSDALLMGALQDVHVPGYAALILRRSYADLALPGAIMDRALSWLLGRPDVRWVERDKTFVFPSGATITFGYLQNQNDHFRYSSAEFQYIGFDEVTQFIEAQYVFLLSRLRRLAGSKVPLRMRSATNPVGPGKPWVHRRFIVEGPTAISEVTGKREPRLFVPARLEDNPYLDQVEYERSLAALDPVTRAQLREGDWNVRQAGALMRREWFPIVPVMPAGHSQAVRRWDLAATEAGPGIDPDWTVGALVRRFPDGRFFLEDIRRIRGTPFTVERLIRSTAESDGHNVHVWIEQEPGASGKSVVDYYRRVVLPGFSVWADLPTGDKVTRAMPLAAQAEAGNFYLVQAAWNGPFLDEAEAFPDVEHDDQIDAVAGAFGVLTQQFGQVGQAASPWR